MSNQQTLAIEHRNSNILVSASAGAGKTYMLIERLAQRIIQDQVPVDRILAVTFTKAAAAEMKSRLAKKLFDIRQSTLKELEKQEDPVLKKRLQYLDTQLANLPKASISTIDSFCLSIIQQYYAVISLNPSRLKNTLSGASQNQIETLSFQTAFQHFYKNSPERVQELFNYFSLKPISVSNDGPLYKTIERMLTVGKSAGDLEEWLTKVLEQYPVIKQFKEYPVQFQNTYYQYFNKQIQRIQRISQEMELALSEIKPGKAHEKLVNLLSLLQSYQAIPNKEDYRLCTRTIHSLSKFDFRVNNNDAFKSLNQEFKTIRNELEDLLIEEDRLAKESIYLHNVAESLVTLCRLTNQKYETLKEQYDTLDFNDMARFAMEILEKDGGYVAKQLQSKYLEIMVDEFQDTSEIQNKILEYLSNGKNFFRVGDLKQSIYGFRQAKPELMARLLKEKKDTIFHLENNYRSKNHIVQFTNLLFDKLMNYPNSPVTYGEEDQVTIGNPQKQSDQGNPKVSLILSHQGKPFTAQWIGQQILKLHKEGKQFRDICVLCSTHNDKIDIREVFENNQIPYSLDAKQGFFKSIVVQFLISLVSSFIKKESDIPLLSVLQSPLFDVKDETLAYDRLSYEKHPTPLSFSEYLLHQHPTIKEQWLYLQSSFEQNVETFLSDLSMTNHFYDQLPVQQKTNFDFLCQKVQQEKILNSFDFFQWLTNSEEESSTESNSHLEEEDLVKVETIHHSKGLQYDVVFLYQCDKSLTIKDPVTMSYETGIGLNYHEDQYDSVHSTLMKYFLDKEIKQKLAEEFLRLAYVGVTRAKEKLFLVSKVGKTEKPTSSLSVDFILETCDLGKLTYAALKEQEGPYYHFEWVEELEEIKALDQIKTRHFVKQLPSYSTQEALITSTQAPSHHFSSLGELTFHKKNIRGMEYGTQIHQYLETLDNRLLQESQIPAHFSYQAKESILYFQNSEFIQSIYQTMTVEKEVPFYFEKKGLSSQGIIDFLATSPSKVIILDYKTDHLEETNLFVERYQDQLKQYRHIFESADIQIETWIYSLHLKQFILVP